MSDLRSAQRALHSSAESTAERGRSNPELWAACIGGALPEAELAEVAGAAGLVSGHILERFDCWGSTELKTRVAADLQLHAVHFFAQRPA